MTAKQLYKIIVLDYQGKPRRSDWVEAASDDEAIRKVQALKLGVDVELLLGGRLVRKLRGRTDIPQLKQL